MFVIMLIVFMFLSLLGLASSTLDADETYDIDSCDKKKLEADSSDRTKCLQFNLGKNNTDARWSRGFVDQGEVTDRNPEYSGYMYQTCECPLTYFSERHFCDIMRDKHILAIGDSTMERLMFASQHIFRNFTILSGTAGFPKWCPTPNGCERKPPSFRMRPSLRKGCVNDDRANTRRPLAHMGICVDPSVPDSKTQTTVSYIRHDYIHGHHGHTWNKNSVCDYWKDIVESKDLILTTFGAHIPEVLSNPFGGPTPNGAQSPPLGENAPFNSSIIRDLALKTANVFKEKMKDSAVLVFIAGSRGVGNASSNCSIAPVVQSDEISIKDPRYSYHWHNIQTSNEIYIEEFRAVLGTRVVVLDTLNLFTAMVGCRSDDLHFRSDVPASPMNIIWQIIYNILVEMEKSGGVGVRGAEATT